MSSWCPPRRSIRAGPTAHPTRAGSAISDPSTPTTSSIRPTATAIGASMFDELAVWAWRHPSGRITNFGDELGPAILTRLGYVVRRVNDLVDADLVACGSILEIVNRHTIRRGLMVWGSGLMH